MVRDQAGRSRMWLRVLGWGLALWALAALLTFATGSAALVPVLVLVGSFLVPVTFVVWASGRLGADSALTRARLATAFLVGGTLGVLAAAALESYVLRPSPWVFVGVGLIEEGVKLAALWLVAAGLTTHGTRDGAVLGAAVGFGFAALESVGYAVAALLTVRGPALLVLVETEVLRSLLAPFGHGLWTAIVGAVLFRTAAGTGRLRPGGALLGSYLGVVALHALWDSMREIAIAVALSGDPARRGRLLRTGYVPTLTSGEAHVMVLVQTAGWIVVTVVALLWLRALLRPGRPPGPPPPPAPGRWPGWG